MEKTAITEDEYIAELNAELVRHPDYHKGMAFVPAPEGATGHAMSGYSVTGPFSAMGIYATVAHIVAERFHLKTHG